MMQRFEPHVLIGRDDWDPAGTHVMTMPGGSGFLAVSGRTFIISIPHISIFHCSCHAIWKISTSIALMPVDRIRGCYPLRQKALGHTPSFPF